MLFVGRILFTDKKPLSLNFFFFSRVEKYL